MKKRIFLFAVLFLFLSLPSQAVKLVTWNVLNFPGSTGAARAKHFRLVVNRIAPDVLVCQEMVDLDGCNQFLTSVMNYTTPAAYSAATFTDTPESDNALFYRKETITYQGKTEIKTALRNITEYRLKVRSGPGAGTVFRVYSMHLKAGTRSADKNKRAEEAKKLRNRLNSLPRSTLALACGDLNLYSSDELAYQILTNHDTPYNARLNDPIQKSGDWHDGAEFALIHTQSPRKTQFGGGASGGLDDRFDFILISDAALTSPKLGYVSDSYKAYGNDGKHFNKAVNVPPHTHPKAVVDALWAASDHLPIVIELLPQSEEVARARSVPGLAGSQVRAEGDMP